uniref:Uncharacterized protein n=1 Tax=Streptomyces sp. HK1 TaxID=405041 RepID=B0LU21_9ACTN|nr:unknown [Streptomyces sp. HK1]
MIRGRVPGVPLPAQPGHRQRPRAGKGSGVGAGLGTDRPPLGRPGGGWARRRWWPTGPSPYSRMLTVTVMLPAAKATPMAPAATTASVRSCMPRMITAPRETTAMPAPIHARAREDPLGGRAVLGVRSSGDTGRVMGDSLLIRWVPMDRQEGDSRRAAP